MMDVAQSLDSRPCASTFLTPRTLCAAATAFYTAISLASTPVELTTPLIVMTEISVLFPPWVDTHSAITLAVVQLPVTG